MLWHIIALVALFFIWKILVDRFYFIVFFEWLWLTLRKPLKNHRNASPQWSVISVGFCKFWVGSNSGSFSSHLALISTLFKGNCIQFWVIEIQVEGGSFCAMSSFLTYEGVGWWVVLFGTEWHMQTHISTCALSIS